MSKQFRLFVLAMTLVGLWTQVAHADEGITAPAATDKWKEDAMGKIIKFNWQNGCSGYTLRIRRIDNNAEIFFALHGVATANPESYTVGVVPDPGGASGSDVAVRLEVVYTHTDGTTSTLTQDFTITNK